MSLNEYIFTCETLVILYIIYYKRKIYTNLTNWKSTTTQKTN